MLDKVSAKSSERPWSWRRRLSSVIEEKGRELKEHLLHCQLLARGKSFLVTFWHCK
jgi:hypothetical protein